MPVMILTRRTPLQQLEYRLACVLEDLEGKRVTRLTCRDDHLEVEFEGELPRPLTDDEDRRLTRAAMKSA
jgi:hypothetical protein